MPCEVMWLGLSMGSTMHIAFSKETRRALGVLPLRILLLTAFRLANKNVTVLQGPPALNMHRQRDKTITDIMTLQMAN